MLTFLLPLLLLPALLGLTPATPSTPTEGLRAGHPPGLASPGPQTPRLRWRLPVAGPMVLLRVFAPPPPDRPWLPGHRGVDLAADVGSGVLAAGAGVVTFAARLAGRGVVVVSHGLLRTTYEPVLARVGVGAAVAAGDLLGVLEAGATHCRGRPCLHWGLRRGRDYLDPLLLLGPGVVPPRVRLLPFLGAGRPALGWAGGPGPPSGA